MVGPQQLCGGSAYAAPPKPATCRLDHYTEARQNSTPSCLSSLAVPGSSGYMSDSGTSTSISTGGLGGKSAVRGGSAHGAPSPSYPAGHIGVSDDEGALGRLATLAALSLHY